MPPTHHPGTTTPDRPCGLVRRLLAMAYDALIVLALLLLAGLVALPLGGSGARLFRDPLYTCWIAGVWFAYFGWCWTRGGQTVGMRAWGVRIETGAGGRPGWRASTVRLLVACVSAAALGAGFLWALGNADRAGWHDLASHTRLRRLPRAGSGSDRTAQHEDHRGGQQQ